MRLANTVPLEAEVNQSCPSPRGRGKVMVVGNATSGRISQASSFPGFREQHSPLLALLPVRPRTPHAQSPPAAGWAPPPHQASQRRGCGGQPAMHCTGGGTSARSRSAAWMKHGRKCREAWEAESRRMSLLRSGSGGIPTPTQECRFPTRLVPRPRLATMHTFRLDLTRPHRRRTGISQSRACL